MAPAALLANYKKERAKHLTGKAQRAALTSMQNMARKGTSPSLPMLIVDEAHRARDPASATYRTLEGNTAEKRLLLSGSPFYNHPSDIAPLVNLAAGSRVLPSSKEDFSQRYITEENSSPPIKQRLLNVFRSSANKVRAGSKSVLNQRTAPELRGHLAKWVDYHPGSTENFPEVTHEDVNVPMSDAQLRVYDTLMDKAPAWVAAKVKSGLPPNKREAQQLNAFLTAARQASNTTAPFIQEGTPDAPKIQMAFDRMKKTLNDNPNAKGVVYSNYLGAGIAPYKQRLDEAKIPYGEFTGEMPPKQRDQLVRDYNDNKIRALLLSSAGGEGLDLKGTRLLQMLEPHWNAERGHQVEGRGARYMSHAHLPEEERKLQVERYLSTRPQGRVSKWLGQVPDKSVDEYLTQMSSDKENLINQFKTLLPKEDHMLRAPRTGVATQKLSAIFDELEKLGAISDDQARRSLDRLDQLEKNTPTGGQVARYGALGAGAGALGHVVSRAIEGGAKNITRRSALGAAAAGAIGMGGVPLVRGALDRHAEKRVLRGYLHQPEEKVGATLDTLQQAYKRIAPLRNKIKPSAKVLEHVMEAPTPGAMGIREMSALNGPGTLPRPAQMGMLRQRPAIMAENTRALGGTAEQVKSMIEQGNAQVEGTRQYIGNAGGAILMPPGGLSGWAARANANGASPIVPPAGAAQQRAANILTGVHEGFERSTKSSPAPYFSHFSPSVIHKEHNMVAGLEGPGAEEGRKYFQGMRAGGEGPAHAEQLQVMYGDKAAPWATYGQGPKLPKAMRKDMIRNWPRYQEHERGKLRSLVEKAQQEVAPGGITFDEGKVAASAPTRGNFMMASDIPSFRAPRLDVAIQKDGAFGDMKKGTEKDSDSIGLTTYSPGDFRQVNINAKHAGHFKLEGDAVIETDKDGKSLGKGPVTKEAMLSMSTEKLAEFVAELREMRKEAIAGLTPASQLEKTTRIGAPKASAPPGPSIAQIARPRGKAFGLPMSGCMKTKL